ncbi:MAG: DNA translocase FtsK [Clostridia bacterium]|nr:DNA translocase FtsK [Clostridia bacterium]
MAQRGRKSRQAIREERINNFKKQAISLCLMAVGIFLLFALITNFMGMAGTWLKNCLFGLFGLGGYAVPVVLFLVGLDIALDKEKKTYISTVVLGVALVLTVGIINSFFYKGEMGVKELFESGLSFSSGGVICGGVSYFLSQLIGKVGTGILLAVVICLCVIVTTGITVKEIIDFLFINGLFKLFQRKEEQPREETEEKPKRRKIVDIPIDDEPVKKESEPINPDIKKIISSLNKEEKEKSSKEKPSTAETLSATDLKEQIDEKMTKAEITKGSREIEGEINTKDGEGQIAMYNYPPTTLLEKIPPKAGHSLTDLEENAEKLVSTLRSFGVETTVINIVPGPRVTRYELQPKTGVKISKITSLSNDIALSLAAEGVRIEAPIPGKAAVGIEIPNKQSESVTIREMLESDDFKKAKGELTFVLGKDISGNVVTADLSKMPHLLIAGATGSGKSVCTNSIITSIIYKNSPDKVKLMLIDPKMVEFGVYNGIPHLLIPVVTNPKKAASALNWAVGEMLKRYNLFAEFGVRDITGFNKLCKEGSNIKPMEKIVIIIDELADLMMAAPKEVEDAICRLAQMARAAGMHLIIATQRPSVDVITGTIKANIPSRIALTVSSQTDSRIILDAAGADKLLGRGDMLFNPVGMSKPLRVQCCFISDKETEKIVDFIKQDQSEIKYDQSIVEHIENETLAREQSGKKPEKAESDDEVDELFTKAVEYVVEEQNASATFLQRKLKLGYARAARILDELYEKGIVGPYEGSKPRKVLITKEQYYEMLMGNQTVSEDAQEDEIIPGAEDIEEETIIEE